MLTVAAEDDTGAGLDPIEVADLSDAMAYLNQALGSFGVNLSWAAAGTTPDVTVHFAATTPEGGVPDGVLGYTTAQNDVYFVTGWNYSTSTDPTQVASDQFDFMTLAIHELGHTLGLGESQDPNSVMYEYLAPGTVRRTFTDSNLSLIDTNADRFMKVASGVATPLGMSVPLATSAAGPAASLGIGEVPPLAAPLGLGAGWRSLDIYRRAGVATRHKSQGDIGVRVRFTGPLFPKGDRLELAAGETSQDRGPHPIRGVDPDRHRIHHRSGAGTRLISARSDRHGTRPDRGRGRAGFPSGEPDSSRLGWPGVRNPRERGLKPQRFLPSDFKTAGRAGSKHRPPPFHCPGAWPSTDRTARTTWASSTTTTLTSSWRRDARPPPTGGRPV